MISLDEDKGYELCIHGSEGARQNIGVTMSNKLFISIDILIERDGCRNSSVGGFFMIALELTKSRNVQGGVKHIEKQTARTHLVRITIEKRRRQDTHRANWVGRVDHRGPRWIRFQSNVTQSVSLSGIQTES